MGYLCIVALIFAGELGIKNYVENKRNAGEEKEICPPAGRYGAI